MASERRDGKLAKFPDEPFLFASTAIRTHNGVRKISKERSLPSKRSSAKGVLNGAKAWTSNDSSELYDVKRWGKGYFAVGENGHVLVHPDKDPSKAIDLKELTDTLLLRGISPPILIRFADILKHRLGEIHGAFKEAMEDHGYQGNYCCVYPIKVNQQRQVVQEVLSSAARTDMGWRPAPRPSC